MRLELFLPGERVDPFDTGEEEQSQVLHGLLANMGLYLRGSTKMGRIFRVIRDPF